MFNISLSDKKIKLCITHIKPGGENYEFSPDMDGVRDLWRILEDNNGLSSVIYSSSVDWPEDAGLSEDFDLDSMLEQMKDETLNSSIDEMFASIDKLVNEGNIQKLAECSKRFILMHYGKSEDEYDI